MGITELNHEETESPDYYEFLQISPSATADAIHRIYRFWAARYHPDNPDTGNYEKFHRLRTAYDVLSDPELRAKYDSTRCIPTSSYSVPLSSVVDFMDEVEGESNCRLALISILYLQRRSNPRHPEVSLRDLEAMLGFPRDYLDFTTWYLIQKAYISRADNSDFTITVAGVDYVETQRGNLPAMKRLLTSGKARLSESGIERRVNTHDRRIGLPDTRTVKTERRMSRADRRANRADFRMPS